MSRNRGLAQTLGMIFFINIVGIWLVIHIQLVKIQRRIGTRIGWETCNSNVNIDTSPPTE